MNKLNLLVPISFNFQIRYLLRSGLLKKFNNFCNPILLLFWKQDDLINEIRNAGYEYTLFTLDQPSSKYISLKENIDYYYQKKIVKSPTLNIKNDRNWKRMNFKKKLKYFINLIKSKRLIYSSRNYYHDNFLLENHIQKTDNYYQLSLFFKKMNIGAIFTTAPFLYSEEFLCRIAKHHNIPIYYSVLSFDNLTTRGNLPFIANHYFVWNNFNKNELMRIYPLLNPEKISIVGPVQFDFYYTNQYIRNVVEWKTSKAIPKDRPVIMYGANAKYFVPNEYLIIRLIDEAISQGKIFKNPVVLLRPHPTDSYTDWEKFAKTCKNVYIEKSLEKNQTEDKMHNKFSNFSDDDVANFCSTLAHSDIHISYASTLALDGACFDKPQICPYFAPDYSVYSDKEIQNLYHSEHYTPIRLSGAIDLPRNGEELIKCINRAIKEPALKSRERSKLLDQMITYQDGRATDRIAQEMEILILKLQ